MKNRRHMKILEIINNEDISTQGELADRLRKAGEEVTQATVSRDIKELNLVKVAGTSGRQHYAVANERTIVSSRLIRVFRDSVLSVDSSGNMILIKTFSGGASAAAEVVDGLDWDEILGTLAGDNTILVVVREGCSGSELADRFRELIK